MQANMHNHWTILRQIEYGLCIANMFWFSQTSHSNMVSYREYIMPKGITNIMFRDVSGDTITVLYQECGTRMLAAIEAPTIPTSKSVDGLIVRYGQGRIQLLAQK